MDRNSQKRYWSITAVGVAGIFALNCAFAAPPPVHQSVHSQLDLRAPSHMPEVGEPASQHGFSVFPSHRQIPSSPEQLWLPVLGTDSTRARPTIQEFVHRVRQEGLPVARLFEGKSALVHLGLNPKGKPGLWLVQKTH